MFVCPVCQLHWLFASRLRQWEVCVCFCSRMSVTLALCWSTSAVGSVCVCVFVFPVCQLHWLFASRLRQWEVCVCVFVLVGQLHWLFASRLRQREVCVCVFLFPYVSYTGSLLVDFGSGKCVCVCFCSRMSVTLVLC